MNIIWLKKLFRPIYVPLIEKIRFANLQRQYPIRIMSSLQTIRYIKKHHCSISRYGDGEFHTMFNNMDLGFQAYNKALSEDLKHVISMADEKMLVCFPKPLISTSGMKASSGHYWRSWCMNHDTRIRIQEFIVASGKGNLCFGDAMLTRPYIDWKSKYRANLIFKGIKSIWEGKDILIVEGEQTRLGVGNDLFEKANSIRRILVPVKNAYASYDKIKTEVIRHHADEMVLLAIGPTATVLAFDLSKVGIQTLDIGHIDIEYEWFLSGAKKKEAIKGKYTNEVREGHAFSECKDINYIDQIIARIDC